MCFDLRAHYYFRPRADRDSHSSSSFGYGSSKPSKPTVWRGDFDDFNESENTAQANITKNSITEDTWTVNLFAGTESLTSNLTFQPKSTILPVYETLRLSIEERGESY